MKIKILKISKISNIQKSKLSENILVKSIDVIFTRLASESKQALNNRSANINRE